MTILLLVKCYALKPLKTIVATRGEGLVSVEKILALSLSFLIDIMLRKSFAAINNMDQTIRMVFDFSCLNGILPCK